MTNSHGGQRQLEARLKKMAGGEKIEFRGVGGASFNGKPGATPPNWIPKDRVTADMPVIYVVYNAADANARGKNPLPDKPRERWSDGDLEQLLQGYIGPDKMSEEEIETSMAHLRHEVQCATEKGIGLLILSNTHYGRTGRGGPAGGRFAWKIPASVAGKGKNNAELSVKTVSDLCFLRVSNAAGPHWRTTESPFQIVAPPIK